MNGQTNVLQMWGSIRAFKVERERRRARARNPRPLQEGPGELVVFPIEELDPVDTKRAARLLVDSFYAMSEADRRWISERARERAALATRAPASETTR